MNAAVYDVGASPTWHASLHASVGYFVSPSEHYLMLAHKCPAARVRVGGQRMA